jgi:hypothetical protein
MLAGATSVHKPETLFAGMGIAGDRLPGQVKPGKPYQGLEATTYIPGSASAWAVGSRDHVTNGIIAVYGRLP